MAGGTAVCRHQCCGPCLCVIGGASFLCVAFVGAACAFFALETKQCHGNEACQSAASDDATEDSYATLTPAASCSTTAHPDLRLEPPTCGLEVAFDVTACVDVGQPCGDAGESEKSGTLKQQMMYHTEKELEQLAVRGQQYIATQPTTHHSAYVCSGSTPHK